MVNRRGRTNARFVAFVALINRSEAKIRRIIGHLGHRRDANCSLRRADIEICPFFVNNDRASTLPLAHARGVTTALPFLPCAHVQGVKQSLVLSHLSVCLSVGIKIASSRYFRRL